MKLPQFKPVSDWPRWPLVVWAGYLLVVFTCNAFAATLATSLLVVMLVVFLMGTIFVVPVVAYARIRKGQSHRAWGPFLVPILLSLMLLSTPLAEWGGDLASFYRLRDTFQHEVDRAPGSDKEKLLVFGTDGFLDSVHGYAYDGSDEVNLPAGQQSDAWKKRAYRTEFEDLCFTASHITGHYYSFSVMHGCDKQ